MMTAIITMPQWLTLDSIGIAAATIIIGYVFVEVGFFFHYHWHLVPRANQISSRPPAPYRDYIDIKDREKLLIRILDRLSERVHNIQSDNYNDRRENQNINKRDVASQDVYRFIESWFHKKTADGPYDRFSEEFDMATLDVGLCPPPRAIFRMAWSSIGGNDSNKSSSESLIMLDGESSDKESSYIMQNNECNKPNGNSTEHESTKSSSDRIQKGNMDEFLSWAFFGVPFDTVQSTPSMQQALDNFYIILQTRTGLSFEPGSNPIYKPRSFTFEKSKSLYRPCGVYAAVALMRMTAN
ncbi:hypothetical protein ACHAXR_012178 [Thalassiosira sp. AJA248-18]